MTSTQPVVAADGCHPLGLVKRSTRVSSAVDISYSAAAGCLLITCSTITQCTSSVSKINHFQTKSHTSYEKMLRYLIE